MAVVKRLAQPRATVKKTTPETPSVLSTRQPSRIEEMGDANFGTLDATKDGSIVTFDVRSNKFILTTPDQVLATSAEDNDISDTFVTQLEQELDLGSISIDVVDGGSF